MIAQAATADALVLVPRGDGELAGRKRRSVPRALSEPAGRFAPTPAGASRRRARTPSTAAGRARAPARAAPVRRCSRVRGVAPRARARELAAAAAPASAITTAIAIT